MRKLKLKGEIKSIIHLLSLMLILKLDNTILMFIAYFIVLNKAVVNFKSWYYTDKYFDKEELELMKNETL